MKSKETLPMLVISGLPFTDSEERNARIGLRLLRATRSPDVRLFVPDYRDTPPDVVAEQIREEVTTQASDRGPLGVVTMSLSVPFGLTAVQDLGSDVVAAFAGIAGAVDVGEQLPAPVINTVRQKAPLVEAFIEKYKTTIRPHLGRRVRARTLSLFSRRDDSVPPEMSSTWASENVPLWTPPLPTKPELGYAHGVAILFGMRSRTLRRFMQLNTGIMHR